MSDLFVSSYYVGGYVEAMTDTIISLALTFALVGSGFFLLGWFSGRALQKPMFTPNDCLDEPCDPKESARRVAKAKELKIEYMRPKCPVCPVETCHIRTPHSHAQAFLDRLKDSPPRKS